MAAATFAPGSRVIALAGSDRATSVWDVFDPSHPLPVGGPLAGHTAVVGAVAFTPDRSVTFSLDGSTLVTGSDDGVVTLFDLSDPTRPSRLGTPLDGLIGRAGSVAFTPGGRILAVPGKENSVLLWDLDLTGLNDLRTHALEQACARTGRGLNEFVG